MDVRLNELKDEKSVDIGDLKAQLQLATARLAKLSPFSPDYKDALIARDKAREQLQGKTQYGHQVAEDEVDDSDDSTEALTELKDEKVDDIGDLKAQLYAATIKLRSMSPFDSDYQSVFNLKQAAEEKLKGKTQYGKSVLGEEMAMGYYVVDNNQEVVVGPFDNSDFAEDNVTAGDEEVMYWNGREFESHSLIEAKEFLSTDQQKSFKDDIEAKKPDGSKYDSSDIENMKRMTGMPETNDDIDEEVSDENDHEYLNRLELEYAAKAGKPLQRGVFELYGRTFKTYVFQTQADANAFMMENSNYGVIGTDSQGIHVAQMDDEGEFATIDVNESKANENKRYRVTKTKHATDREYTQEGTLSELIEKYSYTLETGASYSHEKGNERINLNPKTIESLVDNLENAVNNAAANGYAGVSFDWQEIKDEVSESVEILRKLAGLK